MKSLVRLIVCACCLVVLTGRVYARQAATPPAEDKTPPSYDMKAQAVLRSPADAGQVHQACRRDSSG